MSLFSAAGDLGVMDGVESVTYQRTDQTGAVTGSYAPVSGLRLQITQEPVGLGGPVQGTPRRTRWHLDASTLPTVPRKGDRIVSLNSGTWVVLSDQEQTQLTRYACDCQLLSV